MKNTKLNYVPAAQASEKMVAFAGEVVASHSVYSRNEFLPFMT